MGFTNREITDLTGIPFEKWRRWAREFDPRYTPRGQKREYTFREAFKIRLGGFLVGDMAYRVVEARVILEDLDIWLTDFGFYSEKFCPVVEKFPDAQWWAVRISPTTSGGFIYQMKGSIEKKVIGQHMVEFYYEDGITPERSRGQGYNEDRAMTLQLSSMRAVFMSKLGLLKK